MSGTISNFFNDVGNTLEDAVDDVATEVGDVADDVRDDVNGNDDGTATPTPVAAAPATPVPATPAADDLRSAQVVRLYDTVFDRPPEEAGLTFWTNALRAGVGLDNVAELFVASPEFQDRYGDIGTDEFVTLLYRNVLDREPDPEGQAFWTSNLQNGVLDRDDVVLAFSESPEHVAKVGTVSTDDPLV